MSPLLRYIVFTTTPYRFTPKYSKAFPLNASLSVNPKRQTLFEGLTFYFMTEAQVLRGRERNVCMYVCMYVCMHVCHDHSASHNAVTGTTIVTATTCCG